MPRTTITPEVERQLLAAVRSGAHPRVAAVAVGLPPKLLAAWLQLGRGQARGRCRRLWRAVCQARAWARMRAEIEVRQKDVKFWLRYGPCAGPGRLPPWAPARPRPPVKTSAAPPDDLQPLLAGLLAALEPYPEARQAVLAVLEADAGRPAGPGPNPP